MTGTGLFDASRATMARELADCYWLWGTDDLGEPLL
jgi:hypothetical protein